MNDDIKKPGSDYPAGESPLTTGPETAGPRLAFEENNGSTAVPVKPAASRTKWWLIAGAVLVLIAAAAAYWFVNSTPGTTPQQSSSVTKKDIASLRYVTTNYGWDAFYPASDWSTSYVEANMNFFEGLVKYENKTQIVPLLATGWKNPSPDTWVFTLKQGVRFHTGREMTAEDVKLSFEQAKNTATGEVMATTIASVTVTGPYEVTITTDGPDPALLKKLVNYFVYDTKSGKAADPINGTGPFIVKPGTTPKNDLIEMTAFDKYHGGRINVRNLSFKGVDSSQGGELYADNQADVLVFGNEQPPRTLRRAYTQDNLDQVNVFLMPLNTTRAGSPLQNLKVRQALYLATDPAALAKVRQVEVTPVGQLVPSSIPGYNPAVSRPARDIAKAKQLLAEAGYPKGFSLAFTYLAASQTTAEEIARQMADIGVILKLDPQAEVSALGKKAEGGGTDMYFMTYGSDILDASDVLAYYNDTPNYRNQKVTDLLKQAQTAFDTDKRLSYLKEASKVMADDVAVIPYYSPKNEAVIYNPSYVIERDIASSYLGVYFQEVYAK